MTTTLCCARSNHPADTGHATMAPRLSRGEYWLLTKASEYGLPLHVLGLPDGPPWTHMTMQDALNCRGHGMDTPTLARTVLRLLRRRWIALDVIEHPTPNSIVPDLAGIERALHARGPIERVPTYSLTPLGGQVWESFAQPNWDRYIEDCRTDCAEGEAPDGYDGWERGEVITAERGTLDRYMQAVRDEECIVADSESIEVRHDWTYCYWKPPRSAYVWRFLARNKDRFRPPSTQWHRERWCEWR